MGYTDKELQRAWRLNRFKTLRQFAGAPLKTALKLVYGK
jgi:hypothetical protein